MIEFIKSLFKQKSDVSKLVRQGAVIIDVRTEAEYRAGHISESRNIPLDRLKRETAALKKLNKPIITVCRSGNRSRIAASILTAAGVQVHNGGAWTDVKRKIQ